MSPLGFSLLRNKSVGEKKYIVFFFKELKINFPNIKTTTKDTKK
jgi:hypothetical protein